MSEKETVKVNTTEDTEDTEEQLQPQPQPNKQHVFLSTTNHQKLHIAVKTLKAVSSRKVITEPEDFEDLEMAITIARQVIHRMKREWIRRYGDFDQD